MGGSLPPRKTPPEAPIGDGAEDEHRPTLVPNFDPSDFARDSEIRQRASAAGGGEPTIDQARRLHVDGENEKALFLVAHLLQLAPLHPEATKLAVECRRALERQCLAALGSDSAIYVATVSTDELKRFALDNVSAFLLSHLDGATSVETVLDISGLPRLLVLRHLRNLIERGIITLASGLRASPPQPQRNALNSPMTSGQDDGDSIVESVSPTSSEGLAALDAVPLLLVAHEDLHAIVFESRARSVLAYIDEHRTVEEVLAAAQVGIVDGLAIFERLAEDGVVSFV
jgi:hypothetical protein